MSFWSRLWIDWWCLVPGVASILWMFLNPIVFKKPTSTKNWASKAVLGERVYLNRDQIEIPEIHCTPLNKLLNGMSSIGLIMAIWSTIYFSIWGAVVGVLLTYIGKSWYLDRMVWLYEYMKNDNDIYKSWDY